MKYEVTIDTGLDNIGVIIIDVDAETEKEAHDKAFAICRETYKDEYRQSRERAAKIRSRLMTLRRNCVR